LCVYGQSTSGTAIFGNSAGGYAVRGSSTNNYGVYGTSSNSTAIYGSSLGGPGVYGTSTASATQGIYGQIATDNSTAVLGRNDCVGTTGEAVSGYASAGAVGVQGISEGNDGVVGRSNASGRSGIVGTSTQIDGFGGYFANSANGGVALRADGLAQVKTLQILGGADLAEPFDVDAGRLPTAIEPGMVVAIDARHPGGLRLADTPYDATVAGVISGAHGLAPGLVMKARGQEHVDGEHPVALSGRVWCWVDATAAPVHPGDLLTTSSAPGVAMRAIDASRARGATLGKAMTSLERGTGLVLVLVTLQ